MGPEGEWVELTQAAYDALSPPDPAILYIITATAPPPAVPVVEAGVIVGTLQIGNTLSLSGMSVTGADTTTYDWKVDGVTRATTATYVPAHAGSCICTVTGANAFGSTSDSTPAATVLPLLPVVEAGAIGTPQIGQTLSLSGMSVTGADTTTYDWKVDGPPAPPRRPTSPRIPAAASAPSPARMRPARSATAPPRSLSRPRCRRRGGAIAGTPYVGETLSLSGMSVTGADTTTYAWKIDGVTLGTSATFSPPATGSCICTVTGTNATGSVSDSTAAVAIGPALPVVTPGTIAGILRVGETLSLSGMSSPARRARATPGRSAAGRRSAPRRLRSGLDRHGHLHDHRQQCFGLRRRDDAGGHRRSGAAGGRSRIDLRHAADRRDASLTG